MTHRTISPAGRTGQTGAYSTNLLQLLEHAPDGVFTIGTDLAVRYVNPAFCRILGFEAQELIGTSITEYLGDLNILEVCMTEVQAHGHCSDQETLFRRRDGSMVRVSKNVQAIYDDAQEIREILVTIRDLTEIYRMNRRLEQSLAELAASNQALQSTLATLRSTQTELLRSEKMAALGALVAGVAHEINTPVGIGVTAASYLGEEVRTLQRRLQDGGLTRSQLDAFLAVCAESSDLVLNNLRRAAELISSFKQIAVDQTNGERRRFDLGQYLQEVVRSLQPQLRAGAHQLVLEAPAGLHVTADPGNVAQVVTNLVMNSLIHGFEGRGQGRMRLSLTQQAGVLLLRYEDDGRGITPDHLPRIFEPFFTTRRGQGGSGLGLHIVYNLVTQGMNGSIDCHSYPGQGTVFEIRMPQAGDASDEASA